ncbi:MAG TPA: FecR domain-containing protein [Rhodocyclaceae bacterium]|nr:FecR domain-containing protein [Rhodocyclaceae bacterium]
MLYRDYLKLSALLLVIPCAAASAAQLAVVDTVQAPAWVVRGGKVLPLAPGMEIVNSDHINTGANARAYIRLTEGSVVKLGANTKFTFYSRSQRPSVNYRAALDIAEGAFRYTTSALGKLRKRDLSVRVGTSTIGIRGTDIWGRSNLDEDMAVLIEGKVEISRGAESVMLSDPMTQYRAPKNGEMAPLAQIDSLSLAMLARETEIQSGDGASKARGDWDVVLGTVTTQDAALAMYDQARKAGFAAKIKVKKQSGAYVYSVLLPGAVSQDDALSLAERLKVELAAR